jgi:hypothetical protein
MVAEIATEGAGGVNPRVAAGLVSVGRGGELFRFLFRFRLIFLSSETNDQKDSKDLRDLSTDLSRETERP